MAAYESVRRGDDDAIDDQREIWLVSPSMQLNGGQMRFLMRSIECVFAIVAFVTSLAAIDLIAAPAWNAFFVLVAALAFVIDLSIAISYCYTDPGTSDPIAAEATSLRVSMIELCTTALWSVVWFIAAIVYLGNANAGSFESDRKAIFRAAGAFGILSSFVWMGTALLLWRQHRSSLGLSARNPSANS